uniref:C-type lectin domain family 17, member A-like n=1 Tax=Scatophagus argus TaxID=75038 RepID=UPI001ED7E4D8|nr:C-type lectin domain family 17, member A-like [Scatophagus argus]
MSLTFNGKSEELQGDSWNLITTEGRSKYGWRSSVCRIGAAAVCLGLLLLTVILVAHNTSAINQWDTKYKNLIYEITKGRDNLRDERDQLMIHSSNLTQEIELLQGQYNAAIASRDKLQEEVKRLSLNRTDTTCHQGWIKFNNKCYYVSPNGLSKTWTNSRKDCQERGADLVIITTKAELDFVSRSYGVTWIGLRRTEQEHQWKWVDGSNFEEERFWQPGEPNNVDGQEHCAEVSRDAAALNDVPCSRKFPWVCED